MELFIATKVLMLGLLNPQWFTSGPYEYIQDHQTVAECQLATVGTDDICTTEAPFRQYSKVETDSTPQRLVSPDGGQKLNWVECDHWSGCYEKADTPKRNYGLKYGKATSVFYERNFARQNFAPVIAK
tara:strand:- start:101 stop:484 length:384 start_codon:yes stop_codon:yes gene_type:complete